MTPLVCLCQQVPEEDIERACQRGASCLDDVRAMTGACTGCGDCAADIEDILACYTAPVSR
jgi:NAD(P)H-nitrite reductase large subunit